MIVDPTEPISYPEQGAPRPEDVIELFHRTERRVGDRIAISTGELDITYRELDARSETTRQRLEAMGLEPETPVAVYADRSPEALIAALAILKAGYAYVPVDPAYPAERIHYVLADSGAPILCVAPGARASVPSGVDVVEVADWDARPEAKNRTAPRRSIAYVMYTSGSTGRPKGVMVEHAGLLNLILDHVETFDVTETDRLLLVTSLSFDASMFQMFTAWATGACLLLPPDQVIADPEAITRWINTHRATLLSMPPAYLHTLGRRSMPSLRLVNTGGDAAIVEDALHYAHVCRYFSTYGPTETTICTAWYEVCDGEQFTEGVPLGCPIRNASMLVVDTEGNVCAPGRVGEIWIAGAGVARGYLERPELTAARFVPHPTRPAQRAYRTGDLGYQRADGVFVFKGRVDRQVKVRGFRVEPEEVEHRLQAIEGVARALVFPVGDDARSRRLVACVVGDRRLDPAALRRRLARDLPLHMIPGRIVVLDELPRTPNDKIDLARIQELGTRRATVADRRVTPSEAELLDLFEEILGVPIDVDTDFLGAGGDSLSAGRLIVEARSRLGREIPVSSLLGGVSVREIAGAMVPTGPATADVPRAPAAPWYPASPAQRRLWLLSEAEGGAVAYNVCHAWQIEGDLDEVALHRALESVVRRHDALRTRFDLKGAKLAQIVDADAHVDWHPQEHVDAIDERAFVARESRHAFDLGVGPLVRAALLRAGERRWVFTLNIHHIVCDGWSMGVIGRELQRAYRTLRGGAVPSDDPPPLQLKDFTAWHRRRIEGPEGRVAADYWRAHLGAGGGAPPLEIAADRPRPPRPSYAGRTLTTRISPEQTQLLLRFAQRHRATLFAALTVLVKTLLFRETRQRDIALGTPLSERNHAALGEQVGFYVNTVVLRTTVDGTKSFADLLEQLRRVCVDAQTYGFLPFDRVVRELRLPRDPSRSALFDVMIALQREEDRTLELDGSTCARMDVPSGTSKFDLSFDFVQAGEGMILEIEYATDLFDADRIERLAVRLVHLLDDALRRPDAPLDCLSLLPPGELAAIHAFSRGVTLPIGPNADLLAVLDAVASSEPDRTAIVFGDERLRYAEIAAWSGEIARRLEEQLLDADEAGGPIAVLLERSPAFFAVVLGVLRAGRAFVPMDPGLPAERVRVLLRDGACSLLVARSTYAAALALEDIAVLDPGASPGRIVTPFEERRDPGPDAIAYCIYTSGSTGQPKAVRVTRGNLANAVEVWRHDYQLDRPVVLQLASFSFDVSVGDLARSLLSGGTLILAAEEERISPAALARLIERHHVDFVEMTPLVANALRRYLDAIDGRLPPLDLLVVGSDTWRLADLRALRRRAQAATRVLNSYGTTETTIDSTFFELDASSRRDDAAADGPVPIGRPMANVEVLILDDGGRIVGIGSPGELYITGPSVSAGYLGRTELTAERFLPHPFREGERMYRTGDLCAFRADGNVVLFGRADHQTKIRGYRVELEEIERVIAQHERVIAAAALVASSGAEAALVSFVVGPSAADLPSIEAWATTRLPHFMVPNRWVLLEALPSSATGKVDRKALAALSVTATRAEARIAPRTVLERRLLDAFHAVLGEPTAIGVTDSFFGLGGDSVQAIQLVLELRDRGVQLGAADLFRHPTIAGCAAFLEARGGGTERRLDPADADADHDARRRLARDGDLDFYPAVSVQALMLDAGRAHPPTDAVYHGFTRWELEDPALDPARLRAALRRQLTRQTALRVAFARDVDDRWYQRVRPVESVRVDEHDLTHLEHEAQDMAVEEITGTAMRAAFEFEAGEPACRCVLVRRRTDACALILVTHHAADDGWGAVAFENAVWADYAALGGGEALPELEPLFSGRQLVVLEVERRRDDAARAYWSDVVHHLGPNPYSAPTPSATPRFDELVRALPAALPGCVEEAARTAGASLKAEYLGAVLRALAADAGTDASNAWVVTNGRSERIDHALESAGLFWTLVPVAVSIRDRASTAASVDAALREAERRGAWFHPELFGDATLGFPVCFNFTRFRNERQPPGGLRVLSRGVRNIWHFPLALTASVQPESGDVTLHAAYDSWVLPRSRVAALLDWITHNLDPESNT